MALSSGTRVGAYEIVSALGAGGMGEVYRATDTKLKRQVALKVIPDTLAGDPERIARFRREAEMLAALNHPHIAAIYGLEEQQGVGALVMELVEGQTLAELIADARVHGQGPGLPVAEALAIARQIADALEAAHEAAIIHRDRKPANIKVSLSFLVLQFKIINHGDRLPATCSALTPPQHSSNRRFSVRSGRGSSPPSS